MLAERPRHCRRCCRWPGELVSTAVSWRSVTPICRKAALPTALLAVGIAAAGCGSERNTNDGFRPPVTRVIGVLITGQYTSASPIEIGGGPVTFKIGNQTDTEIVNVRIRPAKGSTGCVKAESASGPIPAKGSGTVSATLTDGTCELAADGVGTKQLIVKGERPSGQNVLLLP